MFTVKNQDRMLQTKNSFISIFFIQIIIIFTCLYLQLNCYRAVSSPVNSNHFQSGTIQISNPITYNNIIIEYVQSYSFIFETPFSTNSPDIVLAVKNYKSDNDFSHGQSCLIRLQLASQSSFLVKVKHWNYINDLQISFLAMSKLYSGPFVFITNLQFLPYQSSGQNYSIGNTLTKQFQVESLAPYRSLNFLNYNYQVITFISGLRITHSSVFDLQYLYSTALKTNNTHFKIQLISSFITYMIEYNVLIIGDKSKTGNFDYLAFLPTNYIQANATTSMHVGDLAAPDQITFSLKGNLIFGFNGLFIQDTGTYGAIPTYQCSINFQSSYNSNLNQLKLAINPFLIKATAKKCSAAIRFKAFAVQSLQCHLNIKYYNQNEKLCYSLCSKGFHQTTISGFYLCQACSYECQNCDNNGCTSCSAQNCRIVNQNTCICKTGYYDDQLKNMKCVKCSSTFSHCSQCLINQCSKCQENYNLISGNICQINCSKVKNTTGNRINNWQCPCQAGLVWNSQISACLKNCSLIQNSPKTAVSLTQCKCNEKYFWNLILNDCSVNCSGIRLSTGNNLTNQICECVSGYLWDAQKSSCLKDCSSVENSLGALSETQCKCKQNCFWSTAQNICKLKCSNMINSNGTHYNSTQCNCLSGFVWNSNSYYCWRNCSGVSNSYEISNSQITCLCHQGLLFYVQSQLCLKNCTEYGNPKSLTQCECSQNYTWNANTNQCWFDCKIDERSKKTLYLKNQCECIENYVWYQFMNGCGRNCNIPYADGMDLIYPDRCFCIVNYFWDVTLSACAFRCKGISKASSLDSSITQCFCESGTYWNNVKHLCIKNCTEIKNSTGVGLTSQICQCQNNLIWYSNVQKCLKNCDNAINGYKVPTSDIECACPQLQYWNIAKQKCVINCSMVYGALSSDPLNDTNCICPQKWYLVNTNPVQCSLNCYLLNHSISRISSAVCRCQFGYLWNSQVLQCWKDCRQVAYSTKASNSAESCQCKKNFYWDSDNKACVKDCKNIKNSPNKTISPFQCQCNQGLQWNDATYSCQKLCSTISYSTRASASQNKLSSCHCYDGFVWNESKLACEIDCSLINYTTHKNSDSIDQCYCVQKFYWDQIALKCFRNCTLSINTKGYLIKNSTNQCQCVDQFSWNNDEEGCVKSSQSMMLGVVLLVVGIVGIIIAIIAYKLFTRSKSNAKNKDSSQQTQKLVSTNKMVNQKKN